MQQWDDVRFLLAVIRYGSLRRASVALNVNHATVSRRLRDLERRVGSRLVQRTPDGYVLTPDGKVMFAAGETIEQQLMAATQRVQGGDDVLAGKVRIAMTDLLTQLAAPTLQRLSEEHPGLELQVFVGSHHLDVGRRDVDIALRFSSEPPQDLVGRKLDRMPMALYGARRLGLKGEDLANQAWVRWQEPWRHLLVEHWVDKHYPGARVAARVDSYGALEALVASGAGVGLLTPWSAAKRNDLLLLFEPAEVLAEPLWILMHPDLRGVRRIKVVVDALAGTFRGRGF